MPDQEIGQKYKAKQDFSEWQFKHAARKSDPGVGKTNPDNFFQGQDQMKCSLFNPFGQQQNVIIREDKNNAQFFIEGLAQIVLAFRLYFLEKEKLQDLKQFRKNRAEVRKYPIARPWFGDYT